MKTSELLDRAADVLNHDGWTQFTRGAGLGTAHCVLGGIDWAHPTSSDCDKEKPDAWWRAVGAMATAVGPAHPKGDNWTVAEWNNAPERTKEEVIAMLRAVAATERAREAAPMSTSDVVQMEAMK